MNAYLALLHPEPCALRINDVVFHGINLLLRANYFGQSFRLHMSAPGWSRQTSFFRRSIWFCCCLTSLCCCSSRSSRAFSEAFSCCKPLFSLVTLLLSLLIRSSDCLIRTNAALVSPSPALT